jgi:hypothetical protein
MPWRAKFHGDYCAKFRQSVPCLCDAATGGWGFADIKDGKPGDKALDETCLPCHTPAKERDYVFTRYAP